LNPSAATPPKPPVSGIQPVSATLQPKKKKSEDIKPAVVAPAPEAAKAPNAAAVVPEPAKAPTKAQAAVPAKTPTKVELEQKIATLKIEIKNDLEKVKTAVLEQLQEEEVRLIKYLGMDARIVVQMAPYMAEFFDKLPRCSSDIRMGLNQECEVAYFVIWSTLNELKKQLSMATVEKDEFFMPDKNVATTESIVHDIDAMFPEYTAGVPDLDIYRLFTVGKPGRTVDISAESKIAELFKMTSQEDEYIRTMFKIAKKDESQSPRTPDPGN
jgi:hypothetical protein